MRWSGRIRMGHFPLPLSEAQRIRKFLLFPDRPSSALDPCVGDGRAFEAITNGAEVLRYPKLTGGTFRAMEPITDIATYLRAHAQELGDRILKSYPPLHSVDDPPSPMVGKLLRKPYPAQTLAIMGLVRRWQQAQAGAVIAECGTGKTLISLGAVQTHAENRPFTAVAMVPPQLVEKWCREAMLTLPGVRVFIIDGLRTPTNSNSHHGVNQVKLRSKRIVREGS
jgi:hypothetical protein